MYMCDICSDSFPTKADGTFHDQCRVMTSPGYWEIVYAKPSFREDILGMQLMMFCSDTSGFTICDACEQVLGEDPERAERYGVEQYLRSSPNDGTVDSHAAGMVAGTVFQKLKGAWPSTLQIGGSDNPAGTLSVREDLAARAPTAPEEPTAPEAEDPKPGEAASGCFIATVAYGGADTPEVLALRAFRDQRLASTSAGRLLIRAYYRCGPGLARVVRRSPGLCRAVRFGLDGLVRRSRGLLERS